MWRQHHRITFFSYRYPIYEDFDEATMKKRLLHNYYAFFCENVNRDNQEEVQLKKNFL